MDITNDSLVLSMAQKAKNGFALRFAFHQVSYMCYDPGGKVDQNWTEIIFHRLRCELLNSSKKVWRYLSRIGDGIGDLLKNYFNSGDNLVEVVLI
jgi:hypothetical protein